MNEKLIKYITKKLSNKDEIRDSFDMPTDEQVKYFMLTTFEVVENQCQECYYCKNYNKFGLTSLCKIKSHISNNCFHFTLDIAKVLKKKYYQILIIIDESTRGKHITTDKHLSSKTQKNMIYESIKLYEMIQCYKEVQNEGNYE